MSSSTSTAVLAINPLVLTKMLAKFGIREGCIRLCEAMNKTNSFFAGGSVGAVAQAIMDGVAKVDLKDGSDLDLWVPVFQIPPGCVFRNPDGFDAYNNLATRLIDSALKSIRFAQVPRSAKTRDYRYKDFDSYKIASVSDYRHPETGRTVQVIAVAHKSVGRLPTPVEVIRAFDISVCRFFVSANQKNDLMFCTDSSQLPKLESEMKRRVLTLNPVLRNAAHTAERLAKYYERGYHMEASVACVSCKHAESRVLTLDEAIGSILAIPRNTVETVAVAEVKVVQTPPRKPAAEPVCPPAPERVKPHLTVAEGEARATGGGSAIPTPPEIAPALPAPPAPAPLPYARYYKDLKPLLSEQLINVNIEANGRLQTFRLYESVLRRAMTALGSKGAGKLLLFWRGAARYADYVSDEVLEMIKEMSATTC